LAAYAEFVPLHAKENAYPFVFARVNGQDAVLAMFNPSAEAASAELETALCAGKRSLLAGTDAEITGHGTTLRLKIPGTKYALYRCKR
jgi:hypothetical protein